MIAGIVYPDARDEHATMHLYLCTIVRWAARGTGLLVAALFLAFVVGEPSGSLRGIAVREWVGMLLLFGTIVAMVLAWKWEFPAALVSLCALGAFAGVVHMQNYMVLAIAALPSLLFLLDWKLRRTHSPRISTAG